jgi:hypothetical protein
MSVAPPNNTAAYGFLPWVRTGLVSMAQNAPAGNYVSLQVTLTVNTTATAPVSVRLLGPGQVTGIDPRAITRMEPLPDTTSFEPNYFAAIELATPDFPWMFSPAVPNGAKLNPWLCLVVVQVQPGVALVPRANALSLLQFSEPAVPVDELPNLDEIAFWAHAQVAGSPPPSADADIRAALADPSSGRVSRIVCPRQLQPNTAYIACLVPTYDAGVQAGIAPDTPVSDTDVSPAWTAQTVAPFALPVYASWTFSTGDAGDFASLVGELRPPTVPLDVGQAPMDESAPGFGMPAFPGLALAMEGALSAPQTTSTPWPPGVQAQFQNALTPLLTPPPAPVPIVTPPMYGQWPAAGTNPVWMQDLNFDPRTRGAAGIGVRVVRADQENLIASAWDQFQQLRQANQRLRQFQLARVVATTTLTRQVNAVEGAGSFLQLTRPMHTRVLVTIGGNTATLDAQLAPTRIPSGSLSPAFRRLVRRRGPVGRQLFAAAAPPSQIVERLNQAPGTVRALSVVPQMIAPAGTVLLDTVSAQTPLSALTPTAVATAPGWAAIAVVRRAPGPGPLPPPPVPISLPNDPQAPPWLKTGVGTFPVAPIFPPIWSQYLQMEARFRAAATQVTTYISERTAVISDEPEKPPLAATLVAAQALVVAALNPRVTLLARAAVQLTLQTSGDPLRPQIGAPQFSYAMSAQLTPQQLLPGVDTVPDETAAMLVTNPRFIEAYMVGLNDEIRRELAWRQYPVDSTATFFANFWSSTPDIPPIATWPATNHLGANADMHDAQVVLLVRGEVLRRYPNAIISAIPAVAGPNNLRQLGTGEIFPVFRGAIDPDMTFFGFALTEAQATAGLGYYFVISEHPSEPRFGFAATSLGTTIADWNDLAWSQVTVINNHVSIATPPAATAPGATWGADAAQQAYITFRQPVRVGLLAAALLG